MAPIRYSLHYEDYSEHLMSRFGKLLQMQSLVDMTLMCSSHTLRVHKAVLAASSAYFQDVLQKQVGEPLIILKMRFSVLKCLVEFMYCGKTQCLEENLDELVSAAQFLKIKGLSKVTKEGLGITSHSELPVFTPPVVINRPPQSMVDMLAQDGTETNSTASQLPPATTANQTDSLGRPIKQDMVVRIPFDIDNGDSAPSGEYGDAHRAMKPRRGRPSARRCGWAESGALGRAAERALLRREQDSRKAIHQLKHLQSRHMQDYLERMTLSQAVSSICGPETSSSHSYMNMDTDLMYMDQAVSSNVLGSTLPYPKDHGIGSETITSNYSNSITTSSLSESNGDIGTAMSQYVNALKSAGLPTDLPILFESGDGSYINVNEQVLLDMVQSREIQYEVIEQPNIIEKVADPSEIKSIDDLSKSIERGELLKSYGSTTFEKDSSHEDAINSLNAILPDNLDSFADQQSYVVMDPRLQESSSSIDQSNDFSCIDGDFFTKSMSDDVKKYYADQPLCPTSTALDTNFSMSLLDTKASHSSENMSQHFESLNSEDLRRNDDCYDFGLPLPQSNVFKEDALDCLMSTPKRSDVERNSTFDQNDLKISEVREDLISDLMSIEDKMSILHDGSPLDDKNKKDSASNMNYNSLSECGVFDDDSRRVSEINSSTVHADLSESVTSSGIQWDRSRISASTNSTNLDSSLKDIVEKASESKFPDIDTSETLKNGDGKQWTEIDGIDDNNKENEDVNLRVSDFENDIPYAVGLLPLKQIQPTDANSLLKRRNSDDVDVLDDSKCLKRKVKCKKSS